MLKSSWQETFQQLRREFPVLTFEKYEFTWEKGRLRIFFTYHLGNRYTFRPEYTIPWRDFYCSPGGVEPFLPNLLFHIGLVELISYWKAACPPVVRILPHALSDDQVNWWKRLWFYGLGEFFYRNGIEITETDFMTVECGSEPIPGPFSFSSSEDVIVPVGGGKDSVVTLELLGREANVIPLLLNPRKASLETILTKGFTPSGYIHIERTIHPTLLELNKKGFLNGHTPFSALLAFISLLGAVSSNCKYIALSNESSANEATLPGTGINHQYSKSVGFEEDFRDYTRKYITTDAEYFSFLRPLNELQIARLFAGFPRYLPVFKSCNAGSKTDTWCGQCPKCLFTWIILSPFISQDELRKIFGKDLLSDDSLRPILDQLTGIAPEKPFECIGTIDEVNASLHHFIRTKGSKDLPGLLHYYTTLPVYQSGRFPDYDKLLHSFDRHHVPEQFIPVLKSVLYG